MLLSIDAGSGRAAGARRGVARGVLASGVRRRWTTRLGVARRPASRGALRFVERFALRLADRFAVFFIDAFVPDVFRLDALRDFAAVFAIFRRFLAMRAPFR